MNKQEKQAILKNNILNIYKGENINKKALKELVMRVCDVMDNHSIANWINWLRVYGIISEEDQIGNIKIFREKKEYQEEGLSLKGSVIPKEES